MTPQEAIEEILQENKDLRKKVIVAQREAKGAKEDRDILVRLHARQERKDARSLGVFFECHSHLFNLGQDKKRTMADISRQMGISSTMVSVLRGKGERKLRHKSRQAMTIYRKGIDRESP